MTWTLDPSHSTVTFSAKHMMITTVRGSMKLADADLDFEPDNLVASSVRVSLDAASIDTGQEARDQHLRSADFLNTDAFPTIDFVSTSVEHNGSDRSGKLHGDLTIRGITRPIVLDAEFAGIVPNMQGGERAAFSASATIDRDEFGLNWNVALDQGGWLVSKEIKIEIEVAAVSSAAEAAAQADAETELTEREAELISA
ncbi:MAG: YceI family protein [Chloroflexota bacterium]|nr:YceI family protein [Chloroflexota bacterium]